MIKILLFFIYQNIFSQTQLITKDFDWKIYKTSHFDIYHTTDSEIWLGYLEKVLEGAYEKGKREYNPNLNKRIPFFFYPASKYFQQNSISEVGEGTGGFTEPYKDRFLVYSDGSKRWLRDVIYHEFGHEIQFSILVDGKWESPKILKTVLYPLWMLEGLSENMTDDWDIAIEDMYVRDYFIDGKLPSLEKLFGFGHLKPHQITLGYKIGSKAIRFLKEEYGYDKPGLMLYYWKDSYDINTVLKKLLGINIYEFESKFIEYLSFRYLNQIKEKKLIDASNYGTQLTFDIDDIPVFNISPILINNKLAYISTIKGIPSIVIDDFKNKRKVILDYKRIGVDYIPYSKFTLPIRYLSSSYDGRYIIFPARKSHRDFICIYDTQNDEFKKVVIDGIDELGQISFSGDFKKVVFSAMKNSVYDIYEADFNSLYYSKSFNIGDAQQITNDDGYESNPTYLSDGKVAFICEDEIGGEITNSICITEEGKKKKIFNRIDVSDFYYDPQSDIFYIISGYDGVYNLYSYDYKNNNLFKNTSVLGGVFTPYVKNGKIYFSYFRHGSVHIYESEHHLVNWERIELPEKEISPQTFKSLLSQNPLNTFDYKLRFSTDLFFPAFLYSSPGGFFIFTYWQFSDYAARHNISLYTNYNSQLYLDLRASYIYNRYRTKFIASSRISRYKDEYDEPYYKKKELFSSFGFIYPLDLNSQLYLIFNTEDEAKDYYSYPYSYYDYNYKKRGVILAYYRNKLDGVYLTAVEGYALSCYFSIYGGVLNGNRIYGNFVSDYLRYIPLSRKSTLVNRFFGGFSWGRDYPLYSYSGVGGIRGLMSSRAKTKDVFLYNLELRLPISYTNIHLNFLFPDFYFKSLYLKLFSDNSYSWDEYISNGFYSNSVGFGIDFYSFILQTYRVVFSLDFSKNTRDGSYIAYFYLGPVF